MIYFLESQVIETCMIYFAMIKNCYQFIIPWENLIFNVKSSKNQNPGHSFRSPTPSFG